MTGLRLTGGFALMAIGLINFFVAVPPYIAFVCGSIFFVGLVMLIGAIFGGDK